MYNVILFMAELEEEIIKESEYINRIYGGGTFTTYFSYENMMT